MTAPTDAPTSPTAESYAPYWLGVEAGEQRYLLALKEAGEIFACTTLEFVPYTKRWFMGVANLRGGIFSVIHLATFLAECKALSVPAADAPLSALHWVTLGAQCGGLNCALGIDRLLGLYDEPSLQAIDKAEACDFMGQRYQDAQGNQWQAIELQALAQDARFLHIMR